MPHRMLSLGSSNSSAPSELAPSVDRAPIEPLTLVEHAIVAGHAERINLWRSLMNKMTAALIFPVLVLPLAAGCALHGDATEKESDEGDVQSQSQAIVTNGYASHGTPGNSGAPLDLGPDDGRTCFLQGVTGELKGNFGGTRAAVRVYRENDHWWLRTKAGSGTGVMGHATCVPYAAQRKFMTWLGNTTDGSEASENKAWLPKDAVTAFTQCFLTEVSAGSGFMSTASYVRLQRERIYWNGDAWDSWTLGGNLLREQNMASGGSAVAVCFELYNNRGWWGWVSGGSGSTSPAIGSVSTMACSVQKLSGKYGEADGWGDGARIFPQSGQWRAFSSHGKRIEGECLWSY